MLTELTVISIETVNLTLDKKEKNSWTRVVNDPRGQPTVWAAVKINFVLLIFKKSEDGRTDGCTYGQHVWKLWSIQTLTVGRLSGSKKKIPGQSKQNCPSILVKSFEVMIIGQLKEQLRLYGQFSQRCWC